MKVELLKPGMPVAIKAHGATIETIRRGERAVPGIVLDVGRYRIQYQGACDARIATPAPSSPKVDVVVAIPVIRQWDRRGAVEVNSKTDWVVDLVQPGQCYSWDLFSVAAGERDEIANEIAMMKQRLRAIEVRLEKEVRRSFVDLVMNKIITLDDVGIRWPDPTDMKALLRATPSVSSADVKSKTGLTGSKLGEWLKSVEPKLVEEHRSISARLQVCGR